MKHLSQWNIYLKKKKNWKIEEKKNMGRVLVVAVGG